MATKVFVRNDGETPVVIKEQAYKVNDKGIPVTAERQVTLEPGAEAIFKVFAEEGKGIGLAIEEERKLIIMGEPPAFIDDINDIAEKLMAK